MASLHGLEARGGPATSLQTAVGRRSAHAGGRMALPGERAAFQEAVLAW